MATSKAAPDETPQAYSQWMDLMNPLHPYSLFAPLISSLTQPILPLTFNTVYNVTEENSSAPGVEQKILSGDSYGRQLGKLMDAVAVLIEKGKYLPTDNKALDDLLKLHRKIEETKKLAATSRLGRIKGDLARLKKESPALYKALAATL